MRTMRYPIGSNPEKPIAVVTFRGSSKKDVARKANAFSKRFHMPFSKDVAKIRAKKKR